MLATCRSASLLGVHGHPVRVEVHVSAGVPGFTIVGLPDAACREARDRVRAAVLSSGLGWPSKRVTVNLAPSALPKVGTALDLAMAVGLLVASEQLPPGAADGLALVGELGLDGSLRPVRGALPIAEALDAEVAVVPAANAAECGLAPLSLRPVAHLTELVAVLREGAPWPDPPPAAAPPEPPPPPDLADVRGHAHARRALEVAAAGGHHALLVGPPGSGKTMLAARLPGLLGQLGPGAARDVTRVWSAAGQALPPDGLVRVPPFRAPHHTATVVSLVGGGTGSLRPGEVSLASDGVLFLDELGEFAPAVLDALRQPLEEGVVRVARAHLRVELPARVLLVGATNPCPCGHLGSPGGRCTCTEAARLRYLRRLSGPLLDRFDLRVAVAPPTPRELLDLPPGEATAVVAARVARARARAAERGVRGNALLPPQLLEELSRLTSTARELLRRELEAGRLSGRGLRRVRAVALTLDDLRGGDGTLDHEVVAEALGLRSDPVPRPVGALA